MIKLEHVVLPSPEQILFVIEGMRNPLNSWSRSDSFVCKHDADDCHSNLPDGAECPRCGDFTDDKLCVGVNDLNLMIGLSKAGTDHRKFMRMMPVMVRVTAPLYWWKEYDTYKVGTVSNSCSTMHKIHAKEFSMSDFSTDDLLTDSHHALLHTIEVLNYFRYKYLEMSEKLYWSQLIQILPNSYNQTRNVMLNYEVLANIYRSRKNHKLDEWKEFCKWIETLPYSEIITGKGEFECKEESSVAKTAQKETQSVTQSV